MGRGGRSSEVLHELRRRTQGRRQLLRQVRQPGARDGHRGNSGIRRARSASPQQEEDIAASPPQQDQSTDIKEWWQTPIGKTIGILVAIIVVLTIVVNLAGGEETGSQSNKAEKQQVAQKAQGQGSGGEQQQGPTTEPTDPFANGKYYTFLHNDNKNRDGDQLILGVLGRIRERPPDRQDRQGDRIRQVQVRSRDGGRLDQG